MPGNRFNYLVLFLLMLLNLTYIWQQPYFLTSDGPTHLYNSKMLLDILSGEHKDFYLSYYNLQLHADPNWFTHIALAALQTIFAPHIAEKILMSAYVLLLPLAFFYITKLFHVEHSTLVALVFPFTFHFLFYYGFFNYCLAICFALFFVAAWKAVYQKSISLQLLILLPLSLLVYSTHIIGWLLAAAMLAGIFITAPKQNLKAFRQSWLPVTIAAIPPIVLSLYFALSHTADAQHYPRTFTELWQATNTLQVLNIFDSAESKLSLVLVLLFSLLAITVLYSRSRVGFYLIQQDGFLIAGIALLLLYFVQPAFISMGGFWIGRFSWLPWLMLLIWLATQSYSKALTIIITLIVSLVTVAQWWVRYPYQQKVSKAEADYLSAAEHIPAGSIILPLSFAHNGLDEKLQPITSDKSLFLHAFDYCGTTKPIINLANFEATTGWFPLQWKERCNPFDSIGRNNNIEGSPPDVLLTALEAPPCNVKIDYVITWCMDQNFTSCNQWQILNQQLLNGYDLIYTSPSNRTKLWKNKF